MGTNPNAPLASTPEPLPELVARTAKAIGERVHDSYRIMGGVSFSEYDGGVWVAGLDGSCAFDKENVAAIGCRPSQLDAFPGIRWALVGALYGWLCSECMGAALIKTTREDDAVEHKAVWKHESGGFNIPDDKRIDPDPLRAACEACLAVAAAKEAKG